ncbi:glucose dehydrogenase [Dyadobacter luticola]|uniref:Glucose dehydrogenase n=2 Tax=Dyadobacter luticola TaxID=1979387 RepID=A0A5R9KZ12_9BACT|nr:glucose dehydrogenase [Dyadobacter luticola]
MKNFILPKIAVTFIMLLSYALMPAPACSQSPDVRIDLNNNNGYINGLSAAINMVHAGDGSKRIFVAEQGGTVKVYQQNDRTNPTIFLNMNSNGQIIGSGGERGLLSIAFHPNYAVNGFLYVYYTNVAGNLVLARYTAATPSGNTVPISSRVQILEIPHPGQSNHNGGELHFGYDDGYLYLSTGDGGGSNDPNGNSQNTASLLGKLLRIDVDVPAGSPLPYEVPADNPITGSLVYARGLRNPFRWSFDRESHDIWIGDVGQNNREEIDHLSAADLKGANFGWRCFEGEIATPTIPNRDGCPTQASTVAPVYTYPTGTARGRSVIGGVVYRGASSPLMYGYYIGMDNSSGQIHKMRPGLTPEAYQTSPITGITDIAEDEDGEIYAVTGSTIYRIYTESPLPVKLMSFSGAPGNEGVKLTWQTTTEEDSKLFEIEHSVDAITFETVGKVPSQNSITGGSYQFSHATKEAGIHYYRLKMIDTDDTFEHSRIIAVDTGPDGLAANFIRPSLITNRIMNLVLDEPFESVELIGTGGQVMLREEITGKTGAINIPFSSIASGIYLVRLSDHDRVVQQKVLVME